MKPYKAFLFIGITLLLLTTLLYLQEQVDWKSIPLFQRSTPENININPLEQDSDSVSAPVLLDMRMQHFPYDSITDGIRMPLNKNFKALGRLFQRADSIGQTARVLYFGDSQLEGDFLAATVRQELQKVYGGHGPGLLAADKYYSTLHHLSVNLSSNWKQSERMDICKGNKSLVFRHANVSAGEQAWIKIGRIKLLSTLPDDYRQMRLFFLSEDSAQITIKSRNQVIASYRVAGAHEMRAIRLELDETAQNLRVDIKPHGYFEIECLSLDDTHGAYVDNIPLRGKASPLFSISDSTAIQGMFQMIKPNLFILQFGANIIKYTNEDTVDNFHHQTIEQIKLIRRWCPNAEILLISISDIAHRTNNGVESYGNISKLKAMQYEIAMQYDCAFWDLDHFIKQEGGIKKWAGSSPALAQSDYLHFTKYGARKVGLKLSELLLQSFQ